jgi:RNA polymerase sigma-B factor
MRSRQANRGNGYSLSHGLLSEDRLLRDYARTHDTRLKEELVRRFMPLARALALRYRGPCEATEDLIQVASIGLIKALDGFDLERGGSFKAYAAPTILGELRRHFRDRVWTLRLPRGLSERALAISEASQGLAEQLGRTPTVAEIADQLHVSEDAVTEVLLGDQARKMMSLNAPVSRESSDSAELVETLGREEQGFERVDTQLAAEGVLLTERERVVLKLRFEEDLTQYEIGGRIGVSQMQVSRIMREALRKLLDAVQEDGDDARPT